MSGHRETAVLKKKASRLEPVARDGGEDRGCKDDRAWVEPSRFLKQQIIFPIYEDAREKARQV